MKIHGKERGFLLTVGASADIAKLCPDGDMSRIGEALEGGFDKSMGVIMDMMLIMNKGYEQNKMYETPGYEMDLLTKDELMALPLADLMELQNFALAQFKADSAPEIELEEQKKEEGAKAAD